MKTLRIGAFQFKSGSEIAENSAAILRAINSAAEECVRLLVFHECASCGYPPVETPDINAIDIKALEELHSAVAALATRHNLYVALGTIRVEGSSRYNTIRLFSPDGKTLDYDKRALWGWDTDSFTRGKSLGITELDGIKIGFRICFEVRFPEYFRELSEHGTELCIISFSDTADSPSPERYGIIKSHLITRAVENVMTVVSVNSASRFQTAPTAVFGNDGHVLIEALPNNEQLLVYDYESKEPSFGQTGIIENIHIAKNDRNIQS